MKNEILLLTPGPTMTSSKSKEIMGREVIHHRSSKSWDIFSDTKLKLKLLSQTNVVTSDCVILTSSGTGAMEASIVNFVNSKDKILVFDNGYFSKRYISIAKSYNLEVTVAKSYDEFKEESMKNNYDVFLVTHHQTTTGELTNLEFFKGLKSENTLLIVDSISGLSVHDLKMDDWKIDVVVAASQKGFDVPAGLSFVIFNEKAKDRISGKNLPSYYFDFNNILPFGEKNEPFTTMPSLQLESFNYGINNILENGLENTFRKYEIRKNYVVNLLNKYNIDYLDFGNNNGNVVTTLKFDFDVSHIIKTLENDHKIKLINGYDNNTIRIGHIGDINLDDYDRCIKIIYDTIEGKNGK